MKLFIALLIATFVFVNCTEKKQEQGIVVHSLLDGDVATLDPIHATNKYVSTITGSIFEGLYHYHYLKRPIQIEPMLAEAMPEISGDRKTYTIKIKKGVHFQDDPAFPEGKGRELEAQDFIYSWKRLADPSNKAQGWWLLDGIIVGLNEWAKDKKAGKSDYDTPIAGLKALDKHTLQIQLTRPSFQFVHFLATTPTAVVAREVIEKYTPDVTNHPIGTGPFRLENWVRNSKVELVKNPNYREVLYPSEGASDSKERGFLKHSGEKLPLSDKVVVHIFDERQPLWLSFLKGNLDHGIIPKDNYDQVFSQNKMNSDFKEKGIQILYMPRPDVTYLGVNMEHPILGKNKWLRKAMAAAVDKPALLKSFYNNRGILAEGPIPPGIDSYDPNYKGPNQYNLEQAKKWMVKAGFPEGKGLPVFDYDLASTSTWGRQFGEIFKDMFGKIGIKIRLISNTFPQFNDKIKTKRSTLFDQAWLADYPDSENFLQMFYSKNISPGANYFNYNNKEYDRLYEQALKLPMGPERTKIHRQLVEMVNEDVPAIFMVHRSFRLPFHGWLENFNEYPIIYDHLKYYYVDKDKKQSLLKKL